MTETEKATGNDGRQTAGTELDASKDSESFENLIKEFDSKTGDQSQTADKSGAVLRALKPVIEYVQDDRAEKQQANVDKELSDAVDFVAKGEGLDKLPKPILRGLMEAYAVENKSFAQAFQNRGQAPSEWQAQLATGRTWAEGQMKDVVSGDTKGRDDLEAAKAAVAGTETNAASSDDNDLPSTSAMFNMSGAAWQTFKAEQRAKAANHGA